MTIRSLNDDRDTLSVFRHPDGDIQVTISHHTGHYADSHLIGVRVGGCGSGHDIPRRIWSLLNELATEFEKFEDCKYERDARYKEDELERTHVTYSGKSELHKELEDKK